MSFDGFPRELPAFLRELAANNTREWFESHRDEYETTYLKPAQAFVVAMGDKLRTIAPDVHAEPKVRGSIFAIHRDTRFSKDKTPYKTHLDLWFWQGDGPSRERPGYFMRLTPDALTLGAGIHQFPDAALARFRDAVARPAEADRLAATLAHVPYELGGQSLKRVPAGFEAHTPTQQNFLKYTGLHASTTLAPLPTAVFSPELPDWGFDHFRRVAPLQQWLVQTLSD